MAPINFPSSPIIGQKHPPTPIAGVPTYTWDGEKWTTVATETGNMYVSKAGDTMTGNLTISKATTGVDIELNTNATGGDAWVWLGSMKNNLTRWGINFTDETPETGGNVGSNFSIYRFDDAGVGIDSPFFIERKTGIIKTNNGQTSIPPFTAMAYNGLQVNGAMQINQAGTTGVSTEGEHIVDCWQLGVSAGLSGIGFGYVEVTSIFAFTPRSVALGCNTAVPTLAAGDYVSLYHTIEGTRIAQLGWGEAYTSPITISFWARHHVPGVYSVAIRNYDINRSYITTYTHAAADTPEYHSITIPTCQDGNWPRDTSGSMLIDFVKASGSLYTAPSANTWLVGNYLAAPGQTNGMSSIGSDYYSNVLVLPGSVAPTPYESQNVQRHYSDELALCQRYYYNGVPPLKGIMGATTTASRMSARHPVRMRVIPTVTMPEAVPLYNGLGVTSANAITNSYGSDTVLEVELTTVGTLATGAPVLVYQSGGGKIVVNARM